MGYSCKVLPIAALSCIFHYLSVFIYEMHSNDKLEDFISTLLALRY